MYKKSICLASAGDFIFFRCYFRQTKKVQKKIIVAWAHEKFQSFSTGPSYRGLPNIRPRLREILRSCFTKQFFGGSHTRSSRRTNNPIIRQVKISLILSTLPSVQRRVEIAKSSMVENTKWEQQRVEKGGRRGRITARPFHFAVSPASLHQIESIFLVDFRSRSRPRYHGHEISRGKSVILQRSRRFTPVILLFSLHRAATSPSMVPPRV